MELVQLSYSPWSEKARWALDAAGLRYTRVEHVPMIGEPLLRWRARRWSGVVSVPLLRDGETLVTDSWGIAQLASERSGGWLIPPAHAGAVRRWHDWSEGLLAHGRARLMSTLVADDAALLESVPRPLRAAGPLAVALARQGAAFVASKYVAPGYDVSETRARLHAALRHLAEAVGAGYLVGGAFSFADIAAACTLQFVRPVADNYLRLGPRTRVAWSDDELAAEFAGVVAWRDHLYARHRSQRASQPSAPNPRV